MQSEAGGPLATAATTSLAPSNRNTRTTSPKEHFHQIKISTVVFPVATTLFFLSGSFPKETPVQLGGQE